MLERELQNDLIGCGRRRCSIIEPFVRIVVEEYYKYQNVLWEEVSSVFEGNMDRKSLGDLSK